MQRSIALTSLLTLCGVATAQTAEFIPIPGLGAEPACNENVCIVSGSGGWSGVRVSGDGRVVGGAARSIGSSMNSFDTYAPVVINGATPQLISPLVDGNFQGVNDLNFDGSVAVGVIAQSFTLRAFRWTAAGGLELIDEDAQGPSGSTSARAVNADGTVIVGEAVRFGSGGTTAWIWRAGVGFRDLKQELEGTYELDLQGWQLLVATDVSNDGSVIVGQGRNPQGAEQAFYVRINDAICVADFNQDGGVDGADVEAFFVAWQAAEPTTDINEDGGVDGGDIEPFFSLWSQGC